MTTSQTFTDKKKLTAPVYKEVKTVEVGDYIETHYDVVQRARLYGKDKFLTMNVVFCAAVLSLLMPFLLIVTIPVLIYNLSSLNGTLVLSKEIHQRHKVTGELRIIKC